MQIALKNIHKRFGPVHANNDITITFNEGRIIGVLGENGAGKSTLMKILSGYQPADSGEIWIDDRPVDYSGPLAAIDQGIGMLQQDPLDVGAFTVLENFTFGRRSNNLLLNRRADAAILSQTSQRFGFDLSPETPIEYLSIAQRQQLEIVRLLAQGIRTLILDEPTTGISAEQKDLLFATLRDLAHKDGMIILLVSHKLEDVIALCDEIMVLRAGELVGTQVMPATKAELVHMMFGQELKPATHQHKDFDGVPAALTLAHVTAELERLTVQDFSLTLRKGEVIGLAGLDGSGQQVIMRASAGLLPVSSGQVIIGENDMTGQPYHRYMESGVLYGASGRLEEGLIAGLTLTEHIALVHERSWLVNWERARSTTAHQISHFNVRGRPRDYIESLSGGNQQRVLMAMLPPNSELLVLEEPTRGLDVDSARWIWEQLLLRCQTGTAILFSSADLDEIVTYSDRIIVCYAGRLTLIDQPEHLTINQLGHLIGGESLEIAHDSA